MVLDTSTAIVWKKGGKKFKIVPLSGELLALAPSFKNSFLPVKYASFDPSMYPEHTVDVTYNRSLSQEEVYEHKGWLAVLGGDTRENRELLKRYVDIAFAAMNRRTAMSFWTPDEVKQDQLRALCANNLDNSCNCGGRYLNINARFARVRPL